MSRASIATARVAAAIALVAVVIAVAPAARPAAAQQAPAISSVSLTPDVATIGDRLTLTINVDHAESFEAEGPGFGDNYGPFELIEILEPQREPSGDLTRTTLAYTLTTFTLGTIELPELPVTWSGPSGSGTLYTEARRIVVQSVLAPGETELRPLKPQLDIQPAAPSPAWPAGFVAIFAALTVLGYWLVQRAIGERPAASLPAVPQPLLPHEAAHAALDRLAQPDGQRDAKAYYAQIAAVLRRYLSDRFGFPAYAMTRRELLRNTERAGIDRWPARLTGNLLEECDAVQFAGFRPAPERMDADLTAAYEIVRLTAPDAGTREQPGETDSA